jgi:hypothetical protein
MMRNQATKLDRDDGDDDDEVARFRRRRGKGAKSSVRVAPEPLKYGDKLVGCTTSYFSFHFVYIL